MTNAKTKIEKRGVSAWLSALLVKVMTSPAAFVGALKNSIYAMSTRRTRRGNWNGCLPMRRSTLGIFGDHPRSFSRLGGCSGELSSDGGALSGKVKCDGEVGTRQGREVCNSIGTGPVLPRKFERARNFPNRIFKRKNLEIASARVSAKKGQTLLQAHTAMLSVKRAGPLAYGRLKLGAEGDLLEMGPVIWRNVTRDEAGIKAHLAWANLGPLSPAASQCESVRANVHPTVQGCTPGLTGGEKAVYAMKETALKRAFPIIAANKMGKTFSETHADKYIHLSPVANLAGVKGKGLRPDADKIAEIAARLINEDFGSLHLGRMGRNPTLQKAARLLLLAPDWTESNFRMVTGLVPGLNEKISRAIGDIAPPPGMPARYRQFFTKVLVRSVATTMLLQMLINGWEDSWEFWKEQTENWTNFKRFRWAGVDVTKIYGLLGQDLDDGERKVFSVAGHFLDPLKIIDLDRLIINKGAPVVKIAGSFATGRDYAGRPFTGAGQFLATGKTVGKSYHQPVVGFWNRLPATAANTALAMQPIQAQALLQKLRGEEDGLTALLQAGGIHIQRAFAAPETLPIRIENKAVLDEMKRLTDSGAFTMGPPGRHYAKGGIPMTMTNAQYRAYVEESARIAEPRLKRYVESPGWAALSDEKKAKAFKKVIEKARKKAKGKVLHANEKKKADEAA